MFRVLRLLQTGVKEWGTNANPKLLLNPYLALPSLIRTQALRTLHYTIVHYTDDGYEGEKDDIYLLTRPYLVHHQAQLHHSASLSSSVSHYSWLTTTGSFLKQISIVIDNYQRPRSPDIDQDLSINLTDWLTDWSPDYWLLSADNVGV